MAARKAVNTTRQGAAFELQIMEHLRDRGYAVLRSSLSRGAVDVVAVGDPHTLWIQAKITNPVISPAERRAVIGLVDRINLAGAAALSLVAYRSGGRVHFRELTGTAAGDWESFEPTTHRHALCSCGHRRDAHSMDTGCWAGSLGEGPGCVCKAFEFPADAKRRIRAAGRKTEK